MNDTMSPMPDHEPDSTPPSLLKLFIFIAIGSIGIFLAIWLPDYLEQEEARRAQWRSEMSVLIQTILGSNDVEPVFEGLDKINSNPQAVQSFEFSVVAEALLGFRYHQESFDLADLALKHVDTVADKLRFHEVKARAAFKMGDLALGRSIYALALETLSSNGLPYDEQQVLEAAKLVLLSKWIDQELRKGQCENAEDVMTTIKEMDADMLEGLPGFIQRSTKSIQEVCQT